MQSGVIIMVEQITVNREMCSELLNPNMEPRQDVCKLDTRTGAQSQ